MYINKLLLFFLFFLKNRWVNHDLYKQYLDCVGSIVFLVRVFVKKKLYYVYIPRWNYDMCRAIITVDYKKLHTRLLNCKPVHVTPAN